MPISFYPPDSSDFPFVANESRLQRLDGALDGRFDHRLGVPTFPGEPPTDPIAPPPQPPDDEEAPETPLDEPPPVPVVDPPAEPNTPPLVV